MEWCSILISVFLAIIPAFFWVLTYYRLDSSDPEPKKVVLKLFLFGFASAVPFLLLRFLWVYFNISISFFAGLVGVIVFAVLEELVKMVVAVYVITSEKIYFNQLVDGIIYTVMVSLGFSFVENIFYLTELMGFNVDFGTFAYVSIFRTMGTMLAHTLFSAVAGFIWAYAYFSEKISPFKTKKKWVPTEFSPWANKEILTLHIIRKNILKARPSRRGGHEKQVLVMEGLILAIFLHVIFNVLVTTEVLGQNLTFLVIPLLMIGFFGISYLFTLKFNQKILKVV